MTKYDEFKLRIREDGSIEAELNQGEAREEAHLLDNDRLRQDIARVVRHSKIGKLEDALEGGNSEALIRLGEDLYHAVFPGPIGKLFEQVVTDIYKAQFHGERDRQVRLIIDVDRRSAVYEWPLELMRCTFLGGKWLAAEKSLIALSRRLVLPGTRYYPERSYPPLDVLIIVSKPCFMEQGNGEKGVLAVPALEKIASLARVEIGDQPGKSSMIVKVLGKLADYEEHITGLDYVDEPATFANIREMTEGAGWYPHVMHFIGHGNFDPDSGGGSLGLVDPSNGNADWCSADDLAQMFTAWRPRLVLLQACESAQEETGSGFMSLAAHLVQLSIPAVVAMRTAIRNDYASEFAVGFYDALQKGQDIDSAVQTGRWKVFNKKRGREPQFGVPVLFQYDTTGLLVAPTAAKKIPGATPVQISPTSTTIEQALDHLKVAVEKIAQEDIKMAEIFTKFASKGLEAEAQEEARILSRIAPMISLDATLASEAISLEIARLKERSALSLQNAPLSSSIN